MADFTMTPIPGVAGATVTKGRAGKFDSNGKIVHCGANEKPDGIVTRSAASGEPTALTWGIVKITASEAITAGAELTTAAAGKFEQSDAAVSEWVAGKALQTAASADGDEIPAFIYPPGGGYVKS